MTKAEPAQWAPAGEVSLAPKANDGATFAPGRQGSAFSFDGKGYFDAGDAAAFDIDDRFTLSAWVYSDSAPGRQHRHAHAGHTQRPGLRRPC